MGQPDLWDDAGPFEYRHLPESCIADFFTEERDMLSITSELGQFWLGETRVQGQSPYATIAEAKAAGDERIAEAEAELEPRLLSEAGLDPSQWTVDTSDGLTFSRRDGSAGLVADTSGPAQRWDAYGIGDDPVATGLASVALALAALPAATAP